MARYDNKLFKIATTRPMTAAEIGEIVGCYSADALTRLRARKDIRVAVVGRLPHNGQQGPPKKLYKIEKVTPVRGAYCCGYCEIQRQQAPHGD